MSDHADVIVVGVGLAGLTTAYEPNQRGINILIPEAAERPVKTKLGSHIDLGGQWIGYGHHRIEAYAARAQAEVYKTYKDSELPTIIHKNRRVPLWSPSLIFGVLYMLVLDLLSRVYVPRSWNKISLKSAILRFPTELGRSLLQCIIGVSSTADAEHCSVYALNRATPRGGGLATMLTNHGGAQDSLMAKSTAAIIEMLSPASIHAT